MKTILITTDFSEASHTASSYGAMLAKAMEAKVVLLNVYPFIVPMAHSVLNITDRELRDESEEQLLEELISLRSNHAIEIESRSEQGKADEVILSVAKELKPAWIVAGMKGCTKATRKLFGGTAFSLSRHTQYPVMLIPEAASFTPPKVIALASDISDTTDIHILDPLKQLGERFNSKMYVVRVIKKSMNEVFEILLRPTSIKWQLAQLHPTYEFLNDNDVAHAVNEFVERHKVDIIVMASQEHNLLERIFVKSDIKEMIVQTHVPLLILPGKVSAGNSNKLREEVEAGKLK